MTAQERDDAYFTAQERDDRAGDDGTNIVGGDSERAELIAELNARGLAIAETVENVRAL